MDSKLQVYETRTKLEELDCVLLRKRPSNQMHFCYSEPLLQNAC